MTYKTPLILVTAIVTAFSLQRFKPGQVLSQAIEITPAPLSGATGTLSVPTPTPSPAPTVTPRPTRIPTPTPKPQPQYTSQQVYEFTNQFGGQYGVDPNVLRHIALCESGFRPGAKNYIYAGLFQFDAATWKTFRKKMGQDPDPDLRYNAREAIATAAYAISQGYKHLWPNCQP